MLVASEGHSFRMDNGDWDFAHWTMNNITKTCIPGSEMAGQSFNILHEDDPLHLLMRDSETQVHHKHIGLRTPRNAHPQAKHGVKGTLAVLATVRAVISNTISWLRSDVSRKASEQHRKLYHDTFLTFFHLFLDVERNLFKLLLRYATQMISILRNSLLVTAKMLWRTLWNENLRKKLFCHLYNDVWLQSQPNRSINN